MFGYLLLCLCLDQTAWMLGLIFGYIVRIWHFAPGAVTSQEMNPVFEAIHNDFMEWRYQDNPEFANNIGDIRYTDQVEDYSLEAFETRKVALEGFQTRLHRLGRNVLSAADKVSYDVLDNLLQTWLDGYRWRYYGPMSPIAFLSGIQTNFDSRAGQVKFTSEDQFSKFATRIRKYGDQITQIIVRMNKSIEMGTTLHSDSVINVPGQIDTILQYKDRPNEIPLYSPFNATLDTFASENGILESSKINIRQFALDNINYFISQAEVLKDYMETTYIPNTRAEFGVYNLPNGREYYQACLKWQLSVDITADQIHKDGMKEVRRVHELMKAIVQKHGFEGTVLEYLEQLRSRPDVFLNSSEALLEEFRTIHRERIVPKLGRSFKNVPSYPLEIKAMTYDGPIGIYKNGAPDRSRPGIFSANVLHPENNPTYVIVALMLHETDPGHHFQDAFALTSNVIPLFRKVTDFSKYFSVPLHFPFYNAYSEGWALYAEDLGEELGIYDNDNERLGKYSSEIFRAARMVVDTGIHDKGWTKEQAVQYMLNYTGMARPSIEREMDRYSSWPGQATSYTVGKLKVLELRAKAGAQLCDHFNIAEFHRVMLENGAMPMNVMANLVDQWIMDVKQTAAANGQRVCQPSDAIIHLPAAILVGVTALLALVVNL